MNIKEISKISELIIGNNKTLENKFTNKEIINFFVESGIDRTEIISFVGDLKTPNRWLPNFLKDLYDNEQLIEILINISGKIAYYNPNFKELIKEYISGFEKGIGQNNKIAIFMKYDTDRKVIYDEVISPLCLELGLTPIRADLDTDEGGNIHDTIKDMLDNSSYYIVDISGGSANTFIELGYLLGKNKKVIILIQKGEDRPFNINDLKTINYEKGTMDNDLNTKNKDKLKIELSEAIKKKIINN